MSVAVVVPLGGDCPYREQAWTWVQARYAEAHPDWEVIEARAASGKWCKAAAVAPAIDACEAEIIVQADADVWCDGLSAAVEAARGGIPWAVPHLRVHRLSKEGTASVLAGDHRNDQPLDQQPYRGIPGGGIVVAPREVLQAVPLDRRFVGWGQDDEAHAIALCALLGEPWRGDADLLHLWHPPQARLSRRRGSRQSWGLRRRYMQARHDPTAMRALLEESRDASPALEPVLHGASPNAL